jgi:hypothetical protein
LADRKESYGTERAVETDRDDAGRNRSAQATETALQAEIDQLRATNRPMEFEDAQRATPKV